LQSAQHLPGEEVWVIGEHRSTGERKYYLSNLPADTPPKQLAGACSQTQRALMADTTNPRHGRSTFYDAPAAATADAEIAARIRAICDPEGRTPHNRGNVQIGASAAPTSSASLRARG
jgi:hypothetical protein